MVSPHDPLLPAAPRGADRRSAAGSRRKLALAAARRRCSPRSRCGSRCGASRCPSCSPRPSSSRCSPRRAPLAVYGHAGLPGAAGRARGDGRRRRAHRAAAAARARGRSRPWSRCRGCRSSTRRSRRRSPPSRCGAAARAGAAAALGLVGGLAAAGVVYLVAHQALVRRLDALRRRRPLRRRRAHRRRARPGLRRPRRAACSGLLVDRDFGLAAWQPAWLLAVPALARARAPRSRAAGSGVALPLAAGWLVATFVALTMHGWWWPGRQVVVVLPLAVLRGRVVGGAVAAPRRRLAVRWAASASRRTLWFVVEAYWAALTWVVDFYETANPLYRVWRLVLPDFWQPRRRRRGRSRARGRLRSRPPRPTRTRERAARAGAGRRARRAARPRSTGRWETSTLPSTSDAVEDVVAAELAADDLAGAVRVGLQLELLGPDQRLDGGRAVPVRDREAAEQRLDQAVRDPAREEVAGTDELGRPAGRRARGTAPPPALPGRRCRRA